MTKKIPYLLFVFSLPALLFALNEPTGTGARCKGMGGVSVAVADFWAIQNNQAAMPFYKKTAAGIYYDNRFLLKETSTIAAGFVFPATKGNDYFGLSLNHYGGGNFGNLQAGFAYAKSFANVFAFGLQFDYLYNYFGDAMYGHRSGFTFEIGMYGQVMPEFSVGFHLYNPARLKMIAYNEVKEYIPTLLRLGAAYNFRKRCIVGLDIEKNLETKMQYFAGIEYIFTDYFMLRGGVRLPDFSFSLGMGTTLKKMKIDLAASYHSYLGMSPQLTILYDIK
ncbi:MAG: hypothetical protein FWH36_02475 [Lentimicrobiaceae bacterium]|nr:hypothetical protein [Lentimicrobiaceae bacterium]